MRVRVEKLDVLGWIKLYIYIYSCYITNRNLHQITHLLIKNQQICGCLTYQVLSSRKNTAKLIYFWQPCAANTAWNFVHVLNIQVSSARICSRTPSERTRLPVADELLPGRISLGRLIPPLPQLNESPALWTTIWPTLSLYPYLLKDMKVFDLIWGDVIAQVIYMYLFDIFGFIFLWRKGDNHLAPEKK